MKRHSDSLRGLRTEHRDRAGHRCQGTNPTFIQRSSILHPRSRATGITDPRYRRSSGAGKSGIKRMLIRRLAAVAWAASALFALAAADVQAQGRQRSA